ncbi:hypothetical protein Nepgr_013659 [Nepenthes gracilis]|uniref:RING-type E3 ubiquitin transferase n=1 Tax=Nepenthes gracilis TaxID=150966 RepID=A0AAD3XP67_NEPGR|nr:hypothetical protein Nepgr_013659 [Nepenthes gracilis]
MTNQMCRKKKSLCRAEEFMDRDMDEYTSRIERRYLVSRKGSSIVLRDSTDNNDGNAQICSRTGCSSKLKSTKNAHNGSSENDKSSRNSLRPSASGKEIINVSSPRKSCSNSRKKISQLETDSETSSLLDESEVSETILAHGNSPINLHPKPSTETASSSSVPHGRHGKKIAQSFGLGDQANNVPLGSSISKCTNQGARNGKGTAGYSSSESSLGRKRDMGRKRTGEAESSLSVRGKKISGSLLDNVRSNKPNRGISISDSRRGRNLNHERDNDVVSVRNLWSARARISGSEQENGNRLIFTESPILAPLLSQPDLPFDANGQSSEDQFSVQASLNCINSSSCPGSGIENIRSSMPVGAYEDNIAHSYMNRDSLRRNLDGIAEVLLALDRIEQDEELTYEQLLFLETNLFLGGLGFLDQHRDMRLDIDNMSYEELLALEEKMGTVSTALTEEELEKCLRRSIYQTPTPEVRTMGCKEDNDDIKCSICQEEYVAGEEVGVLGCNHRYHVDCIHQWLWLKNWCPICKASAAPSPSTTPS